MLAETNKALVRRFHEEIFHGRDLSSIGRVIARDFIQYLPGASEAIRGPEGFERWVASFLEAFPNLEIPLEEVLAEDDRVVTRYLVRGTHRGSFMGIPPTNRRIEVTGMNVVHLLQGKFVEKRDEYDLFALLKQLGAPTFTGAGGLERSGSSLHVLLRVAT